MKRLNHDCNHVTRQLGHRICTEHAMVSGLSPDAMPALPEGFAAKYEKQAAKSDDPSHFATKDELLKVYRAQRDGTLAVLAASSAEDLDQPSGIDYAPTRAA